VEELSNHIKAKWGIEGKCKYHYLGLFKVASVKIEQKESSDLFPIFTVARVN
jgi:hypothetical protein